MKKNLLGLIACLSILISSSCTQTLPGGSNTGGGVSPLTSWSCEIDGVPYSWSGTPPGTVIGEGHSLFTKDSTTLGPIGVCTMTSTAISGGLFPCMLTFSMNNPTAATTFNLNPSNYDFYSNAGLVLTSANTQAVYNTSYGSSSFTVNIDSLSNISVQTSGIAYVGGLVTGTFSGTLYSPDILNPQSVTITNGKFRALRVK